MALGGVYNTLEVGIHTAIDKDKYCLGLSQEGLHKTQVRRQSQHGRYSTKSKPNSQPTNIPPTYKPTFHLGVFFLSVRARLAGCDVIFTVHKSLNIINTMYFSTIFEVNSF